MADKKLRVKLIPDLSELKKSFSKLAIGGDAGRAGGGKQAKEEGNRRSKESNRILKSLTNILKFVSLSAFVASIFLGLMRIMEPVFRLFSVILSLLFLPLIPILKPVLKKLGEFASRVAGLGGAFLAGDIDLSQFLGGVFDAIKGVFLTEDVKTAVLEGVKNLFFELGQFVGENAPQILSVFFDIVTGFLKGLAIGFLSFLDGLTADLNGFGKTLVIVLGAILIGIVIAFGGWIAALAVILASLAFKLGLKIGEVLERIFVSLKAAWFEFIDSIKSLFNLIVDKIRGIFDNIGSFFRGGRESRVGDAIIRPNGQIIRTDPADTLIATKDPGSLFGNRGGGGNFTFNITIPAVINNDLDIRIVAEKIAEFSKDELSRRTTLFNF